MNEIEVNLELERTAKLKDKNLNILGKMRYAINEFLKKNSLNELGCISSLRESPDFLESSESYRIGIVILIAIKESTMFDKCLFAEKFSTYEELKEHYTYTILMLRRIEQAPKEEFSNAAYDYFTEQKYSPIFISEILKGEFFERKKEIIINLFLQLEAGMDDATKLKWIDCIKTEFM